MKRYFIILGILLISIFVSAQVPQEGMRAMHTIGNIPVLGNTPITGTWTCLADSSECTEDGTVGEATSDLAADMAYAMLCDGPGEGEVHHWFSFEVSEVTDDDTFVRKTTLTSFTGGSITEVLRLCDSSTIYKINEGLPASTITRIYDGFANPWPMSIDQDHGHLTGTWETAGLTASGAIAANGGLSVDSPAFVVEDGTGALTMTGTLTGATYKRTSELGSIGPGAVSVIEMGPVGHQSIISVSTGNVVLADGSHGAGVLVYSLPEGSSAMLGCIFSGTVTNTANFNATDNDTFSIGIGSVTADDGGVLSGVEVTYGPSTTVDTNSGTTTTRTQTIPKGSVTSVYSMSAPGGIYFNFAINDLCNSGSNTFTATGTLTCTWIWCGDY
jgi:hypothetical protein